MNYQIESITSLKALSLALLSVVIIVLVLVAAGYSEFNLDLLGVLHLTVKK